MFCLFVLFIQLNYGQAHPQDLFLPFFLLFFYTLKICSVNELGWAIALHKQIISCGGKGINLVTLDVAKMLASFLDTLDHGLLTLTDKDTGIVVLLVGLVGTLGVTNLGSEVLLLGVEVISESAKVGPLGVGIDIHLDDTV